MFLVGIFRWWYGAGWMLHIRKSYVGVLRLADSFSIALLARTLFNPFKQISAARVGGSFPVQLQAFWDRLFSRVIGFVIRSFTIFIGVIVIAARVGVSIVSLVAWTLVPLAPIAGVLLWLMGVKI